MLGIANEDEQTSVELYYIKIYLYSNLFPDPTGITTLKLIRKGDTN